LILMPSEFAAGIFLITALSVLALLAGRHLRSELAVVRTSGFVAALLVALFYAWAFSGRLGWASMIPGSVMIWANLMPVLLSFAAGIASRTCGLAGWHRDATIAALLTLAVAYAVTPFARPLLAPIQLASQTDWRGDVCLQSHSSSCAPAAAVTLLRLAGVESRERTLASACWTSRQGTLPLGLYGGLAETARPFGARPRVASADPNRWTANGQLPNIALVRFADWGGTGPVRGLHHGPTSSLQRLLGPRGEGHAIVVLDRDSHGNWRIADPAFGKTTWSDQQFRDRFTGDAIYLDRKPANEEPKPDWEPRSLAGTRG
jgi:hypothetical protein